MASADELGSLRLMEIECDQLAVTRFEISYILGVHFRAGNWGNRRCGCVFTCVAGGRSVYGRVERFWKVAGDDNPGYAWVTWFSAPEYPFGTPLTVKVTLHGDALTRELSRMIPITQIDPSRIMIEPDPDGVTFRVMRDSGYDTMPA